MNMHSMTVRGKDRYKSGVLEYKKMGYWEPDYHAQGHRHHRAVPRHAAGRGRSDRGVGGGRRRILDRDLDRGVDRPADGGGEIPRQMFSRRSGA